MSTGGSTSDEHTPDFMSALSDPGVCLLADKFEETDHVSQWASSDKLDAHKFAQTLARGGREEAMNGVKNVNIFRAVFKLMGGTWKSMKRDGPNYSGMELGAVFKKLAPPHLHPALCFWHMTSYDALMPHCIAMFVVNSLVKALALKGVDGQHLADIPMPEAIPDPHVHGKQPAQL
jgi:hypothetical protein